MRLSWLLPLPANLPTLALGSDIPRQRGPDGRGSGVREKTVLVALVLCCVIITASVAAVVGAVTYAGWMEPGSHVNDRDECLP